MYIHLIKQHGSVEVGSQQITSCGKFETWVFHRMPRIPWTDYNKNGEVLKRTNMGTYCNIELLIEEKTDSRSGFDRRQIRGSETLH